MTQQSSRRTLLRGVAAGLGGATWLSSWSAASSDVAGQQTTEAAEDEDEEEAPTFEWLETTAEIGEDFDYTAQTEFTLESDVYVVAGLGNLAQDGKYRFAYDIYVLSGAGVIEDYSRVVQTDVSDEEQGWSFWYRVSTDSSDTEYASWTFGEYSVVVTVTDFITHSSVSKETMFRLS